MTEHQHKAPANPNVLIYYENVSRAQEIAAFVRARFPELSLQVATTPEAGRAAVPTADIVVGWGTPPGLLQNAPRLKWFHKLGAGVDDIVLSEQLPPDVLLTRTDGTVFAPRMAEYCIAYMLAFSQNVRRVLAQQQQRAWKPFVTDMLAGKTVGVAGVGDIGQEIARKAAALDMHVIGWRRSPGDVQHVDDMYVGRHQFHTFLAAADFIVIVLPLTPETKGLFDAKAFTAMRQGAYVINVGRGPIIVEDALIDALRSGHLGGAALDVFDVEPLPENHLLWSFDNVIITPHMSGPSVAANVAEPLLDNLERYLAGKPLLKVVDRTRSY